MTDDDDDEDWMPSACQPRGRPVPTASTNDGESSPAADTDGDLSLSEEVDIEMPEEGPPDKQFGELDFSSSDHESGFDYVLPVRNPRRNHTILHPVQMTS